MKRDRSFSWLLAAYCILLVSCVVNMYQKYQANQKVDKMMVTISGLESSLEAYKNNLQECLHDAKMDTTESDTN